MLVVALRNRTLNCGQVRVHVVTYPLRRYESFIDKCLFRFGLVLKLMQSKLVAVGNLKCFFWVSIEGEVVVLYTLDIFLHESVPLDLLVMLLPLKVFYEIRITLRVAGRVVQRKLILEVDSHV